MSFLKIKEDYPLHVLVWFNDYKELDRRLQASECNIEKRDPRGRTPLMLAVTLNHLESTRVLLRHGADVIVENKEGYTVVHEAVSTENAQLLQEVLEKRDFQRYSTRAIGIPDLLSKIQDTPDFYVEIRWEFTSWVPLVSRMCPSDTYKVYKCGSSVRIDTTLLGFYQSKWQRGNRSYIFKGHDDGAVIMEVNHDSRKVYIEQMKILPAHMMDVMVALSPSPEAVAARFQAPIVTTYVDTEKIRFERLRTGIFQRKNSKQMLVNGCECRVYAASNVELVTKTRTEHLSDNDKKKYKASRSPFQSFLGIMEVDEKTNTMTVFGRNGRGWVSALGGTEWRMCWGRGPFRICGAVFILGVITVASYQIFQESNVQNPCQITPEEYFDERIDLKGRDIGRPREVTTKIQKFKGTLWLCENYPLSLQEQLIPIIDLMAISNRHFAKLRNFIMHQLPAGFPIKMEIPLFRVLLARVTFSNIFALDSPVAGVSPYKIDGCLACEIDTNCFEVPENYAKFGNAQANKSVEKPPLTAESIAERRERRRQELLAKYGIQRPSIGSAVGSAVSSAVSSPPQVSSVVTSPTTSSQREPNGIESTPSSSIDTPADGRSWRQVAKRIKSIFAKH